MTKIDTKKYKNFGEFFWKYSLLRIGFLWSSVTGLILVAFSYKDLADPSTRKDVLLETALFVLIGGFLFAYGIGKNIWNNSIKHGEDNPDK
jgi:hypothetical protein